MVLLESPSKPIRIVMADDHRLLREGLRGLLAKLESVEVVAEASDGRQALTLVKTHQPDILLTDIGMKGMNGLEAAARVTKEYPHVRVIVLSIHAHEEYVWQALQAGVSGYLLKDSGTEELEFAIVAVARGETYLTPTISKHLVDDYVRRVGGDRRPIDRLTPRHREILQMIAEGETTKEIAITLHLGVKTIETHRMQLMERLDIHDVAGLVRYAIRHRLIELEA
jgi:DNA-binding NarL/FixJ family response regulator